MWWKENLAKHQKVSKGYANYCRSDWLSDWSSMLSQDVLSFKVAFLFPILSKKNPWMTSFYFLICSDLLTPRWCCLLFLYQDLKLQFYSGAPKLHFHLGASFFRERNQISLQKFWLEENGFICCYWFILISRSNIEFFKSDIHLII